MKKLSVVLCSIVVGCFLYVTSASAVAAASLRFNQSSFSGSVGGTISVSVLINPGTDAVSSADAHILYDSSVLQATTVAAGTYFPSVTNHISTGKVSIYATVNDVASSKTGEGTIATVTFSVLKNGSTTLQYFCDSTSAGTSAIIKYDQSNINAPNIIVCNQNGSATVTAGTGGAAPTTAPGGGTLATPTPASSLPATGTVENISMIAIMGIALIAVGGVVKFLL